MVDSDVLKRHFEMMNGVGLLDVHHEGGRCFRAHIKVLEEESWNLVLLSDENQVAFVHRGLEELSAFDKKEGCFWGRDKKDGERMRFLPPEGFEPSSTPVHFQSFSPHVKNGTSPKFSEIEDDGGGLVGKYPG